MYVAKHRVHILRLHPVDLPSQPRKAPIDLLAYPVSYAGPFEMQRKCAIALMNLSPPLFAGSRIGSLAIFRALVSPRK